VNLDFLRTDAAVAGLRATPVARSPMEHDALAAGACFEVRDGWNVAVTYSSTERELEACGRAAGWIDVSHLGKLELQASVNDLRAIVSGAGRAELELGRATRSAGAWWCPLTRTRALVICGPAALAGLRAQLTEAASKASQAVSVLDVTTVFAAITLVGPLAREIFARFSAVDLRPQATPVGGLRAGSIARQPAILVREAQERYLFLFGWALAQYMWTVVEDAGRHLGAAPAGADVLASLPQAGRR